MLQSFKTELRRGAMKDAILIGFWRFKMKRLAGACAAVIAFLSSAIAAHPSLEACGGINANTSEGARNGRVVSQADERAIEDFIRQADGLPGVSIAIVKDDEIVYARGFGYRDLSTCAPATSDTRYYLKSTTKNFLGVAAAVLHEEGAIELDAPVSEYLPELKFPDGLRSEQSSLRDHLTHTQPYFDSGLNYRTAFPGNLPEEDFVEHVNEYSQSKDIKFRYSNFGPIMAAHAMGAKTGVNWREFIRKKIFEPAGMLDSFTVMAEAEQGPMAQGYVGGGENEFEPSLTKVDSQMHAAGGAVSTVADLGRWLIINLNEGWIDGEQVLPKRAIEQAHARQVQLDWDFFEFHRFAHGLGVYSADYDGDLLMHHYGGETHLSFMPEHKLGVVVLANELDFGGRVTHALAASIYDMLLDKADVTARMDRRLEEIAEAKSKLNGRLDQYLAKVRSEAPTAEPVFILDDIIGAYENDRLGAMQIVKDGAALRVRFGAIDGALDHLGGDAYLADIGLWNSMPPQVFVFRQDEELGFVLDWGGRIFKRSH